MTVRVVTMAFQRSVMLFSSTTGYPCEDRGQPIMGLPLRELASLTRLRDEPLGRQVGHLHDDPAGAVRSDVDLELVVSKAMRPSSILADLGPAPATLPP